MALDPKKWTLKTQEAMAAAIDQAKASSNPELTPDHLLAALTRQDDTVVPAVLTKLGQAPLMVRNRADEAVAKLPKAYGGDEPRLGRALTQVFDDAQRFQSDLRDDFLSVEHLLLAMHERLGVATEELLQVLQEVRGSHRVTSQNPEDQFQALERYGQDLTARPTMADIPQCTTHRLDRGVGLAVGRCRYRKARQVTRRDLECVSEGADLLQGRGTLTALDPAQVRLAHPGQPGDHLKRLTPIVANTPQREADRARFLGVHRVPLIHRSKSPPMPRGRRPGAEHSGEGVRAPGYVLTFSGRLPGRRTLASRSSPAPRLPDATGQLTPSACRLEFSCECLSIGAHRGAAVLGQVQHCRAGEQVEA